MMHDLSLRMCYDQDFSFLAPVAPQLQPGWVPFDLRKGQKFIFPGLTTVRVDVELSEFTELVFACRADGRPKAEVRWFFNENPINFGDSQMIFEVGEGRSVLIINLARFNETEFPFENALLGTNNIQCIADNAAGASVTGEVDLSGRSSLFKQCFCCGIM